MQRKNMIPKLLPTYYLSYYLPYYFLLSCVFYFSCENKTKNTKNENSKNEDITQILFPTRADTELYFKNVRQLFYQKKQQSAYSDIYDLKRFSEKQPFKLALLHDWQKNGANVIVVGNPKNIIFVDKDKDTTNIQFDNTKTNAYFILANQIYDAIIQEKQILLVENAKKTDFFISQTDKESWRVTFKDFLGLIGRK